LSALAGGQRPNRGLADRRAKASPDQLREALRGRVTKRHRFLLRPHLSQIDAVEAAMATIDAQVEPNLGPTAVALITSISPPRCSVKFQTTDLKVRRIQCYCGRTAPTFIKSNRAGDKARSDRRSDSK
jgi:hypothetical protein